MFFHPAPMPGDTHGAQGRSSRPAGTMTKLQEFEVKLEGLRDQASKGHWMNVVFRIVRDVLPFAANAHVDGFAVRHSGPGKVPWPEDRET